MSAAQLEAAGDAARRRGDHIEAEQAYLASVDAAGEDHVLVQAAMALEQDALPVAEQALRAVLRQRPTSIAAIRLMAMLALKVARHEEALRLLSRALDLAPGFVPARELRARILQTQNRFAEALDDADELVRVAPANPSLAMLKASLLVRTGRQDEAADLYAATLATHPDSAPGWLSYGHVLKATARDAQAVAAYRQALMLAPGSGEAWWSLANLKTIAFTPADRAAMADALPRAADDTVRLQLHFALGKAHEDAGEDAEAFAHYQAGNLLRRAQVAYRADDTTAHVDGLVAALNADTLPGGDGLGWSEAGPIFVVGLPRSGSTLVEQILASHAAIEGTAELPEMMMIAERLARRAADEGRPLSAVLAALSADERADLGRQYMAATRIYRREDKPLFIDKMPNNWQHVAIIDAILPDARIIDVRRQPMAVGWAAYKQHFARGQEFTYDLTDLGRYYGDYTRLIAAFERARPGRIHRVEYEQLVADTAGEVHALLAWLHLPFDAACLSFWTNARTVRTPSAGQVRQPVFREGLDQWHRFEPWLEPLRAALAGQDQEP